MVMWVPVSLSVNQLVNQGVRVCVLVVMIVVVMVVVLTYQQHHNTRTLFLKV